MILDNNLLFSDAQAVTAAALSTNVIDTAPYFSGNTGRNFGIGRPIYIFVSVDVAFTDSGSDSTLVITLETDDNTAMSSATVLATYPTLAALTAAGTRFYAPMPLSLLYERYIALRYTPGSGNLTTGSLTAGLVLDVDQFISTAPGFTTGVE